MSSTDGFAVEHRSGETPEGSSNVLPGAPSRPTSTTVYANNSHTCWNPATPYSTWVAVAGVRRMDGGGYTITLSSPDIPPWWQLRGILAEAGHNLDRTELFDALGIPDEADEDRE